MITGFNTDIEHDGVIYHVQTEDKGVSTPLILSLVYDRGTILASKRSPYDDLLLPAFDEKALSERLQKQHKLICAAVRAGRIEDLKRMTREAAPRQRSNAAARPEVKPSAEKHEILPANKTVAAQTSEIKLKAETISPPPKPPQIPVENFRVDSRAKEITHDLPIAVTAVNRTETNFVKPEKDTVLNFPVAVIEERQLEEELIIEAVEIIEDETILSAEAVSIVADVAENNQVVDSKLKIYLPDAATFRSGERKTVSISVYRGDDAQTNGLAGAHIMIKVFGAAFRPLIFHAKTDERGAATIHLQMPQFKGGRAAVLIKAMCDGEETELRRAIEQD